MFFFTFWCKFYYAVNLVNFGKIFTTKNIQFQLGIRDYKIAYLRFKKKWYRINMLLVKSFLLVLKHFINILTMETDLIGYKIWKKKMKKTLLIVNTQYLHRVKLRIIFFNSSIIITCITCFGNESRTRFKRNWNFRRKYW